MKTTKLKHHEHIVDRKVFSAFKDPLNPNFNGVIINDGICGIGKTTKIRADIESLLKVKHNRVIYVTPLSSEQHRMAGTVPDPKDKYKPKMIVKNGKKAYYYTADALVGQFKLPIKLPTKSKLDNLKLLIELNENIVMTHRLFKSLDAEVIELLGFRNYHLIIDEEIGVIDTINNRYDLGLEPEPVAKRFTLHNEEICELIDLGIISINYQTKTVEWTGQKLNRYRDIKLDVTNKHIDYFPKDKSSKPSLIWRLNPEIFSSFNSIHVLTYLFNGSLLQGYFDAFAIPYFINDLTDESIFVNENNNGMITPIIKPIHDLIHLHKANSFTIPPMTTEDNRSTIELSSHYYDIFLSNKNLSKDSILKKRLSSFFKSLHPSTGLPPDKNKKDKMWSTFKKAKSVLSDDGYRNAFVPFNTKATNDHREATFIAYFCNTYCPPVFKIYLKDLGSSLNEEQWATSILIQWIFRSAIRDGKHIKLFLPAERMNHLLMNWIEKYKAAYVDRMEVRDNPLNASQALVATNNFISIDEYLRLQPGIKFIRDHENLLSSL